MGDSSFDEQELAAELEDDDQEFADSGSIDNLTVGGSKHRARASLLQSQVVLKTVILAPDCDLSDEALMIENETIANPTNKKIKTEPSPKKQE